MLEMAPPFKVKTYARSLEPFLDNKAQQDSRYGITAFQKLYLLQNPQINSLQGKPTHISYNTWHNN